MKRRGIAPKINADKCIRCGQGVAACPSLVIDLGEKQAEVVKPEWCLGCGHCGAVCPTEAIFQEATSYENYPGQGSTPATSPETLGLLLRERRSVRKYEEDAIPQDVIEKMLEAGRYAPTGSNSQNVNYLVLTSPERILRLRNMTLAFYEKLFARARGRFGSVLLGLLAGRRTLEYLRESLPKVEYAYEKMKKGKDILFLPCPGGDPRPCRILGFELPLQLLRCFIQLFSHGPHAGPGVLFQRVPGERRQPGPEKHPSQIREGSRVLEGICNFLNQPFIYIRTLDDTAPQLQHLVLFKKIESAAWA
jgi:nitroreductase/NAD-dependent dihydropyrimidine dehydrogenase PreA subunit